MKRILVLMAAVCFPISAVSQLCVGQLKVPKYPPLAWAAQLQGSVDLTATIGAQGHVVREERPVQAQSEHKRDLAGHGVYG